MAETEQPDYTILTVQLLSAYVSNNTVASDDLAGLIQSTRAALVADIVAAPPEVVEHVPAVSVRKSIASRDHILSLIDGRPYKTLKRHLASHGLTPVEYRTRYGLPETYPMVAQAYSDQRRAVAQKLGLGQRGTQARAAANAATTASIDSKAPTVKGRGRKNAKPDATAADSKGKANGKVAALTIDAPAQTEAAPTNVATSKPVASKAPAKTGRKPKAQAAPVVDAPAAPEPAKAKSAAKAPAQPKTPRRKLGIKAGGGGDAAS